MVQKEQRQTGDLATPHSPGQAYLRTLAGDFDLTWPQRFRGRVTLIQIQSSTRWEQAYA